MVHWLNIWFIEKLCVNLIHLKPVHLFLVHRLFLLSKESSLCEFNSSSFFWFTKIQNLPKSYEPVNHSSPMIYAPNIQSIKLLPMPDLK